MTKVRSARGELVDTRMVQIKAQLATTAANQQVIQRRKMIAERDAIKQPDLVSSEDTIVEPIQQVIEVKRKSK